MVVPDGALCPIGRTRTIDLAGRLRRACRWERGALRVSVGGRVLRCGMDPASRALPLTWEAINAVGRRSIWCLRVLGRIPRLAMWCMVRLDLKVPVVSPDLPCPRRK